MKFVLKRLCLSQEVSDGLHRVNISYVKKEGVLKGTITLVSEFINILMRSGE